MTGGCPSRGKSCVNRSIHIFGMHCTAWRLNPTRPLAALRFPPTRVFPTTILFKRTASLRHLTARQYRRITAHEALRSGDGHDEDRGASERPPFSHHPHKAGGTPCTQNASDARKHGIIGKQLRGCFDILLWAGFLAYLVKHQVLL